MRGAHLQRPDPRVGPPPTGHQPERDARQDREEDRRASVREAEQPLDRAEVVIGHGDVRGSHAEDGDAARDVEPEEASGVACPGAAAGCGAASRPGLMGVMDGASGAVGCGSISVTTGVCRVEAHSFTSPRWSAARAARAPQRVCSLTATKPVGGEEGGVQTCWKAGVGSRVCRRSWVGGRADGVLRLSTVMDC